MLRALRDSFKHTSIYTVGNLATKVVGLLMIPIYTHFLTPREYGTLDMLDLTIILFGVVVNLGMGSAIFRLYYATESDKERRDVFGSALVFSALVAGALGLGVALAADRVSGVIFRAPGFSFYLRIAILSFCVGTVADTCRNYLRVRQRSAIYVVASLIQLAIALGLNIYFIAFRHLGVLGFLLSTLITSSLASIALFIHALSDTGFSVSIPKTREMIVYGAPFVLTGIAYFILNFADRYFLNLYAGLSEVGVYALGYKFGFMLNMLAVAPFIQMWEAQMFVIEKEANAQAVYARIFEYFAALLLLALLGTSIFIKDIVRLMASPEYFAAYRIVPIVALAYVFNGWAQYFRLAMLLTRRTKVIAIITTGTGVLTLVLYVVLISSHHAMGAAIATLISFTFMMVWTYLAAQRLYPVPYNLRRIAAAAGLAGLCYVAAWTVDRVLGPFTPYGYLLRGMALAAYPVALIYSGFFASEGIHGLRGLPAGIRRIARGGEPTDHGVADSSTPVAAAPEPLVSVIIPTWNRRDQLGAAIASVLAQTYTNYEIVVVDDGSTDGTREWIRGRYPEGRLVYLRQEHRGCSAARNAGIRAARGELLAFLDSDDLWLPRKLECQIPLFDRDPAVGFVFCGSARRDLTGEIRQVREPTPEYRGRAVLAMIHRNMMPTPTVVVRKRLALEAGPMYEDLSLGEDLNYWLRIAARCDVDFVPEVLVHYHDTPGSLSRTEFDSFRANTMGLFEGLYRDPATAKLLEPYRRDALSQAHALIADEALACGRFDAARAEAWKAIRIRLGNRTAWRILPRALLGKRLHGALRRLRGRRDRAA